MEGNKKLEALFGALDKRVSEDVKKVEVAGVYLEVSPMTMKQFTEYALENAKKDEDVKDDNNTAMIKLMAHRIVRIKIADVEIIPADKDEAEEILSGTIMRLSGDDVGELLDTFMEKIGLGKLLQNATSKD